MNTPTEPRVCPCCHRTLPPDAQADLERFARLEGELKTRVGLIENRDYPGLVAYLEDIVARREGDLYAVKPGGSGEVTRSHMVWHKGRKAGRDLPSPAVVGKYMVAVDMGGIGACFDTETGKVLWNDRLGVRGEFAASPLVANGLVYFTNVYGGETIVIKPGPEMDIVAKNSIGAKPDEVFRSTIAPINGKLLIRSQTRLYCVDP